MPKKKEVGLREFLTRYGDEANCRAHLYRQRFFKGFICPRCGGQKGYALSNGRYECARCRKQTSLTAGTVMHLPHLPLTTWFLTFYLVTTDKRGISAVQLAKEAGVTYKTAWYLLRRIRSAMGQWDARYVLADVVELDDTYFGGPTKGQKRGRSTEKAKVFVALSLDEKGNPRYLKMCLTKNLKQASVKKFALDAIAKGAVVRSDGYGSYAGALTDYNISPSPTTQIQGCFTGFTSSWATPRPLCWAPTTVWERPICRIISMSFASAFQDAVFSADFSTPSSVSWLPHAPLRYLSQRDNHKLIYAKDLQSDLYALEAFACDSEQFNLPSSSANYATTCIVMLPELLPVSMNLNSLPLMVTVVPVAEMLSFSHALLPRFTMTSLGCPSSAFINRRLPLLFLKENA